MSQLEQLLKQLQESRVMWVRTAADKRIFECRFQGATLQLRINDWPDEPAVTVLFAEESIDI